MRMKRISEEDVRRLNEYLAMLLAARVGRPEDLIEVAGDGIRFLHEVSDVLGKFRHNIVSMLHDLFGDALVIEKCMKGEFSRSFCKHAVDERFRDAKRLLKQIKSSIVLCCGARLGVIGHISGYVLDTLMELARMGYTVFALDEDAIVIARDGMSVVIRREGEWGVYRVSGSICESAPALCSYEYRALTWALRDVVMALRYRYAYA